MTLETLITFLKIENNNMNSYIVTFEYRVMVTAFAILEMFGFIYFGISTNRGKGSLCIDGRALLTNLEQGVEGEGERVQLVARYRPQSPANPSFNCIF